MVVRQGPKAIFSRSHGGAAASRADQGIRPISANLALTRQARRAKDSSPRREPWEWHETRESPGTGRKAFSPSGFLRPVPGLCSGWPGPNGLRRGLLSFALRA